MCHDTLPVKHLGGVVPARRDQGGLMIRLIVCFGLLFSDSLLATDFLFIGDSHSAGVFGRKLDESLRTLPRASVRTFARCAATAQWWFDGTSTYCGYFDRLSDGRIISFPDAIHAPTPLLTKLLAEPVSIGDRRVTVVALGSNDLGWLPAKVVGENVERMTDVIRKSGSECIWVGPPSMRKFGDAKVAAMYTAIAGAVRAPGGDLCRIVDSRKYTNYPQTGGDGVHYNFKNGAEAAAKWARGVFDEIRTAVSTDQIENKEK